MASDEHGASESIGKITLNFHIERTSLYANNEANQTEFLGGRLGLNNLRRGVRVCLNRGWRRISGLSAGSFLELPKWGVMQGGIIGFVRSDHDLRSDANVACAD